MFYFHFLVREPEQQVQLDHKEFKDQLVKQDHKEKQAQPDQPVLLVQLAKLQYLQ